MLNEPAHAELLLVEDNPTDAELCIRSLKKNNLANQLVWVKDGAEALDFLLARGDYANRNVVDLPKVVLLDLKLPKVDGLEVIRAIRSNDQLKLLPIVVLTSSKDERDILESYKIGANAFVSKPVEFEEFSAAVVKLGLFWLLINKPSGGLGDRHE
jgi:two-component system response regulator